MNDPIPAADQAIDPDLDDLEALFPASLTPDQRARAHTLFFQALSLAAHRHYGGKMVTLPKVGAWGHNWFNVWYTPGVSRVSTTIRDDPDTSFDLTSRGNLVGIVSDSTRVLGDGDVGPAGGLGVMEGKALLMKYLGGVDAVALCIDSRDSRGASDPQKIIDFVTMVQPSFGAINLEDISQPACYRVLDELEGRCGIPVWHDDEQGTACVTLAGLLNSLEIVGKRLADARIVMLGAGAANTTTARLIQQAGGDPAKIVMFDSRGALHAGRSDIETDPSSYRKWELCRITNPGRIEAMTQAARGADAIIALSKPDPELLRPEWIRSMARDPIVFACANPVPEIYPHAAKEAGAAIVATGRGDFPNQVNNSLGFPGILKGALMVRARRVTDAMAVRAARSIAAAAASKGLGPDRIVPDMMDEELFPRLAADVAVQAVEDGVARKPLDFDRAFALAAADIAQARSTIHHMMSSGIIRRPPPELVARALREALEAL